MTYLLYELTNSGEIFVTAITSLDADKKIMVALHLIDKRLEDSFSDVQMYSIHQNVFINFI